VRFAAALALAACGGGLPPATGPVRAAEELPCQERRSVEASCACLEQAIAGGADSGCQLEDAGRADLRVARVHLSASEQHVYLVQGGDQEGWAPIGDLGGVDLGGMFGRSGELRVARLEERLLGGARVVEVETLLRERDSDREAGEHTTVRRLHLCVLADPAGGPPRCPLAVPILRRFEHGSIDEIAPDEAGPRELADSTTVRAAVTLERNGMVTVTVVEGEPDEELKALAGRHRLF
jgi:hypothetical protein